MTKAINLAAKPLITEAKEFNAACDSIRKAGAKLDAQIQHAALSAISHCAQHKDPVFINRLFISLHQGARKSALTGWLIEYGMCSANVGDNKKEMPFKYDGEKTLNMAEAAQNPWYTFKLDPEPDMVFDVQAALRQLLKKAQGKNADTLAIAKVENLLKDLEQGVDTSADTVQA